MDNLIVKDDARMQGEQRIVTLAVIRGAILLN